jgi:hypothetical protein
MISPEVAREARKIPETLEIRSVPCRLPFQDRLSIAVGRRLKPIAWTRYRADNVPIAAYKIEMGEGPAK